MKPVLFLLAFLSLFSFVSARVNIIEIEREILNVTDQMCGDTWCEGNYNFDFQRVTCYTETSPSPNFCEFEFDMISYPTFPRNRTTGYNAVVRNRTSVFCRIFISAPLPARKEDVRDYYNKFIHQDLTDCIFDLEDQLAIE